MKISSKLDEKIESVGHAKSWIFFHYTGELQSRRVFRIVGTSIENSLKMYAKMAPKMFPNRA